MSHSVNNPHDKFVRETFSDPERARAFIEEFLPKDLVGQLDLSSLKVLNDSYLDKEMKEYFSDLILELEIKADKKGKLKIALLFEHKSAPDKFVLIQVGQYLFSHWIKQVKQKTKVELVIPLIYYQGKQKWEVPNLVHLFKNYPEPLLRYVPHLEHIFIALNEISDTQISTLRNNMLAAAMVTQKLRFNPTSLVKDFERILKLFPLTETDKNFLEILVVYSFTVTDLSEKNISESMKKIPQPIKENVMTTYERLIQKGKLEMILALYDDNIGISQIARYAKITEEEVLKILKENGRDK
jgi:predicted transposase/invertase (TIGR01784 family)